MKRHMLIVLLILVMGSMFISSPVYAGWTQAKGHAYNQLTYSVYVSDHKMSTISDQSVVATRNTKYEAARFRSDSVTYYGEYGIIDSLTVFTAVPYKWTNSNDVSRYTADHDSPHGIGDIDFGLRYNIFPSLAGFVISVQGSVKIPEAYSYGDPMTRLSLGDGQYDYTGSLLFGRGLGKGYATLQIAYKYRDYNKSVITGDGLKPVFKPSDQVKVVIGGGYGITSWFSLRGLVDYAHSVGNAEVNKDQIIHAWDEGQATRRSTDDFEHSNDTLIKDTLGLEARTLNVSGSAVFSYKKFQLVFSYGSDLPGLDKLNIFSENSGLGETYSAALVYMY